MDIHSYYVVPLFILDPSQQLCSLQILAYTFIVKIDDIYKYVVILFNEFHDCLVEGLDRKFEFPEFYSIYKTKQFFNQWEHSIQKVILFLILRGIYEIIFLEKATKKPGKECHDFEICLLKWKIFFL